MTKINAQINPSQRIVAKHVTMHDVSKATVGLGNVDNTSDTNKPISASSQAALDLKANQSTTYSKAEVDAELANLVNGAPGQLDTLNELAAALGDDQNYASTISGQISSLQSLKADQTSLNTHIADSTNPHDVNQSQVGLDKVDNTTDAEKPVSSAQQAALDLKAPIDSPQFTGNSILFQSATFDDITEFRKKVKISPVKGLGLHLSSSASNNQAVSARVEGPVTVGHDLFQRSGFTGGFADGSNHFHSLIDINRIEQEAEGDVKNTKRVQERYYAVQGNFLPNNKAVFWAQHRVARTIDTELIDTSTATLDVSLLQSSTNRDADNQTFFVNNSTPLNKSEKIEIKASVSGGTLTYISIDNQIRMTFSQSFSGPIVAASLFGKVTAVGESNDVKTVEVELYGGNYKTTVEVPFGTDQTALTFDEVELEKIGINTIVQSGNETDLQLYSKTNFTPNRLKDETLKATWSVAHGLVKNEHCTLITDGRGDLVVKQSAYVLDPDPDSDGLSVILVYGRRIKQFNLSSFTAFGSSNWTLHKGTVDGIHDDTLGDNLINFNANNHGEYTAYQIGPGSQTDADCISIGKNVYNKDASTIKIGYDNAMLDVRSDGIAVDGNALVDGDLTVDTNTLKVDSTNHRVGIGTTAPNATLAVRHDNTTTGSTLEVRHDNDNNFAYVNLVNDGTNGGVSLLFSGTSNNFSSGSTNNALIFSNFVQKYFRIKNSMPDGTLELQTENSSGITNDGLIIDGDSNVSIPNGDLTVNGPVGIGTTTPSEALDVNGNISASGTNPYIRLINDPSGNGDYAELKATNSGSVSLSGGNVNSGDNFVFLWSNTTGYGTSETDLTAGAGLLSLRGGAGVTVSDNLTASENLTVDGNLTVGPYGVNVVDGNPFVVDSANGRVGVNCPNGPTEALEVVGNTKLSGDLTVDTNTLKVDSANNRVGIGTSSPGTPLAVVGNSTFNGTVKIPTANKSFIKQKCYNKSGGIRLQKATSDADEMIMRYEGVDSNNFVIEQYKDHDNTLTGQATTHGRKSQIKFLGTQNVLRLGGGNYVELDQTRTIGNFDIGVPTTLSSEMLKLSFKDSRTQAHGLHFEHSGANTQVIQMGMYGEYPNADKGDFKITSKIGANAVQDILTIDNASQSLTLHRNTAISGNVGIGTSSPSEKLEVSGNALITGDLTVNGTTTTVDQTNLDVSDNIIGLNRGAATNANDSGIIIERGSTGDNAAIIWDESEEYFILGTTAATPASTGAVAVATGNLYATIAKAAQPNITSLGNLTGLACSGSIIADNDITTSTGYFSNIDTNNIGVSGNLTVGSSNDTLVVDSGTNFVGINNASPTAALDVVGDVDVTGEVDANSIQSNFYYGGTANFAATSVSGDLDVHGNANINGNVDITGGLDVSQIIDCPQINAVDLNASGSSVLQSDVIIGVNSTSTEIDAGTDTRFSSFVEIKNGNSANTSNLGTGGQSRLHMVGENTGDGVGAIAFFKTGENAFAGIHGFNTGVGAGDLQFKTDDGTTHSTKMIIQGDGKVGIGTNSPSHALHIKDVQSGDTTVRAVVERTDQGQASVDLRNSVAAFRLIADGEQKFRIYSDTGGVDRFTIDSAGKVGIGTTAPQEKLDVAGNIHVTGDFIGLYHKEVAADTESGDASNYYHDAYSGERHLSLFIKNSRADIIRYRDIDNYEYWDGSAWIADSSKIDEVKKLLDGRQDTQYSVPSRDYKFRFTVSASTSWPTAVKAAMQTSWSGSSYPGSKMIVEEYSGSAWETRVTAKFGGASTALETTNNNCHNWGLNFISTNRLHTGKGSASQATRITVDFYGWTPNNANYVTIPLQNLFITSNYAGTENTDYSNLLDYDRNLKSHGTITPGIYADATARDNAITSPTAGMMVFITSGTKFQGYTGSAWVDFN